MRWLGTMVLVAVANLGWAAAPPGQMRDLTDHENKEVAALEAPLSKLADHGAFEQAAKVAEQVADYRRAHQGARHWQAMDARFAIDEWKRVVAVAKKDRTEVLRSSKLEQEGVDLVKKGRFEEAGKPLRQALRIREKVLGGDHPQTAGICNSVAYCLNAQGKAAEALPLYRRALRIREKVLGREHPHTAISYNNVASCLQDQGKAAEALPLYRKALGIREKVLGDEHPDIAESCNNVGSCLDALGKAAEALPLYRRALRICEKSLGKDHPHTAASCSNLAYCLHAQGKAAEALPLYREALRIKEKVLGGDHPDSAAGWINVASCLKDLGKAAEALRLYRQALRTCEKVLGEDHPYTATSCEGVANCLQAQGKAAAALPLYRRALRIREKVFGADHPDTAASCSNVGSCLHAQGKAAEALPLFRRALRIREKVLGGDHPNTATSCNNVAHCLEAQGKIAEALPLFRKARLIYEKVLGADHPFTATGYSGVAYCLQAQGKAAEALPLYRKSLEICEKVHGVEHPDTAQSYNNVAYCLQAQGKAAAALPLFDKALRIREKVLGQDHTDTATSCNNVAYCLQVQGKAAAALALFRQALRIREKVLGADHPDTATIRNNLASCLVAQGQVTKALPLYRQALRIKEKVLGGDHPNTVASYNNVAACLWRQERRHEAVLLWQQSLRGQEAARAMRAESGFERAQGESAISIQAALAVSLAQLKQPCNAFHHAEASLARGLLDDLAGLSADQRDRAADLRGQMDKLEPTLASFSSLAELTDEQKARQEGAKRAYHRLWREWSELFATASAGAVLPLARIQRSIQDDAALVLWIEELGERWACVVRSHGAPIWQKLEVTTADAIQAKQLYSALTDPSSDDKQRQPLLATFRKERFDALRPHLKGVKQLFVVPTGQMAYIPADLLAEDFAVRYVPSGSVLASIVENHRVLDGSSLLVLGDPTFDRAPPAEPPASGVLIQSVLPNSFAAKAGLQSGDVLLSIDSTKIAFFDDLQGAISNVPAKAQVWRDGKTFAVRLQGSPLGAVFDKRSARAAVRAFRREREAIAQRGTGHKRLPGTRLEVEAISALVSGSTHLLGTDESERRPVIRMRKRPIVLPRVLLAWRQQLLHSAPLAARQAVHQLCQPLLRLFS